MQTEQKTYKDLCNLARIIIKLYVVFCFCII
jgi:hypothetical protein